MTVSRRTFLSNAAAVTAGFAGLRCFATLTGCTAQQTVDWSVPTELAPDPKGLLDLPPGFSYHVFSRTGEKMDDGLVVPGKHDGMAAFEGPGGVTILVRNHEVTGADFEFGPFGLKAETIGKIDQAKLYDRGYGKTPMMGGTTTLVYDTQRRKLLRHSLSLAGTERNCAGGPTPWGSWVTCEETGSVKDEQRELDHGYNFEVPASIEMQLADPVPLKAMGRFMHEAIAVDPSSGIVYETEDRDDGVLYRFIPDKPGKLAEGGRLQVLVIKDKKPADLRNWPAESKKIKKAGKHDVDRDTAVASLRPVQIGEVLEVEWVDIDDVEAPEDDLRYRAFKMGAARFARAEGIWHGNDSIYFATTTGGPAGKGQIWRYRTSPHEGTDREADAPATLELFIEPNDKNILQHADNLCVAPNGHIIVCEDGGPVNHVLGVTPAGEVYKLARNSMNKSELAGSCFSPDGTTLFVNIQNPGMTIAITGPWSG